MLTAIKRKLCRHKDYERINSRLLGSDGKATIYKDKEKCTNCGKLRFMHREV